jgi:hypothetical protein
MLEIIIQQAVLDSSIERSAQVLVSAVPAIVENYSDSDLDPWQAGQENFLTDWFSSPETARLRKAADRTLAFAEPLATPQVNHPPVIAPEGWRSVEVAAGVTAYNAPSEEAVMVEPVIPVVDAPYLNAGIDVGFDGTRHPYVSEIGYAEIMANEVAPQKYIWNGTWQGEGYDRERDRQGQLVAYREGGADIHLGISFDASVTDPKQPNLRILLINDQAVTAQVTNLSAFLMDQLTGAAIERRDFEQLPPAYEVTLTLNGGFKGAEMRLLEPSGTLVFEYHVSPQEMQAMFPIKLEGINRLFDERVQEIEDLAAQGWIVMEVPPPS